MVFKISHLYLFGLVLWLFVPLTQSWFIAFMCVYRVELSCNPGLFVSTVLVKVMVYMHCTPTFIMPIGL